MDISYLYNNSGFVQVMSSHSDTENATCNMLHTLKLANTLVE